VEKKTISAKALEIIQRIALSTPHSLVEGSVTKDLISEIQNLLISHRSLPVTDSRLEEFLSKIIFAFSPCARLVETYVCD
jgi:hypothetical protein